MRLALAVVSNTCPICHSLGTKSAHLLCARGCTKPLCLQCVRSCNPEVRQHNQQFRHQVCKLTPEVLARGFSFWQKTVAILACPIHPTIPGDRPQSLSNPWAMGFLKCYMLGNNMPISDSDLNDGFPTSNSAVIIPN